MWAHEKATWTAHSMTAPTTNHCNKGSRQYLCQVFQSPFTTLWCMMPSLCQMRKLKLREGFKVVQVTNDRLKLRKTGFKAQRDDCILLLLTTEGYSISGQKWKLLLSAGNCSLTNNKDIQKSRGQYVWHTKLKLFSLVFFYHFKLQNYNICKTKASVQTNNTRMSNGCFLH